MDWTVLGIFQSEVAFQCKAFQLAAHQYDQALADMAAAKTDASSVPPGSGRVRERIAPVLTAGTAVWAALQAMLVCAANLSKLLWGSEGKGLEEQRKPLRDSLGVTDDSHLRSRALRNDFEHFDERLDDWHKKGTHSYAGRNIGATARVHPDGDPYDRFQHYDPETEIVTFWRHSVSIPDLRRAIDDLEPRARHAIEHGGFEEP